MTIDGNPSASIGIWARIDYSISSGEYCLNESFFVIERRSLVDVVEQPDQAGYPGQMNYFVDIEGTCTSCRW